LALGNKLAQSAQSVAQRQLTIQEQIAASAQTQIELLSQIANGGGLANTNDQYFSGSFSGTEENAQSILTRARLAGEITAAQQTALTRSAGFYGTTGEGRANEFFANNSAANNLLMQLIREAGLDGFASGGLITGGVSGKDSVPVAAMPGEFVLRQSAVRSIGLDNVRQMNTSGRNIDNKEMANLREDIANLTNVVAMMGEKLIGPAEQTAKNTAIAANGARARKWNN